MRGLRWLGILAAPMAWLGGAHLIPAGLAFLLFVWLGLGVGSRPARLLGALLAPILLLVFVDVQGLQDIRSFAALPAAALAWIPLFVELGGDVPRQVWALPVVLLLMVPLLVGPWSTVLVASDIAVRAQVLLLGVLALAVVSFRQE